MWLLDLNACEISGSFMATEMHCLGLNYTGGGGEHSFTVGTSVSSSERWGSNDTGLTQLCK